MKKLQTLLILFSAASIFAQKESLYFSVGKPWFPDKYNNLKNLSLGINYQNRFASSFGFEFLLEYSASNDFPTFYDDPAALSQFLLNLKHPDIVFVSSWSKITNINLGSRLNYLFVNNKKFLFNFHGGIGYLFSQSSANVINEYSYNPDTNQVLSYKNSTDFERLNAFYYSLGLQFQYTLFKNYFIGITPYFFNAIDDRIIITKPVYPTNYNLTFNIGKKF